MPANGCFDDKKLVSIQADAKRGAVVYVWSPRMVYSVQQLTLAARAAATNGLDFFAVHDARVPQGELGGVASEVGSTPLCSPSLIDQQALRHFPTAFIITAQGVHRYPIVGAMPAAAWQSSIAQRLQQP